MLPRCTSIPPPPSFLPSFSAVAAPLLPVTALTPLYQTLLLTCQCSHILSIPLLFVVGLVPSFFPIFQPFYFPLVPFYFQARVIIKSKRLSATFSTTP